MSNIFKVKTAGDDGFRLVEAKSKQAALLRVSAEYFSAEPVSKGDLVAAIAKGVKIEKEPAGSDDNTGGNEGGNEGGGQGGEQ